MTTKRKKGHAKQPPAEERHWYGDRQQARAAKRAAKSGGKPAGGGKGSGQGTSSSAAKGSTRSGGSGGADRPSRPSRSGKPDRAAKPNKPNKPGEVTGEELVTGRNPVVEALRARVPATALHVAKGLGGDDRVRAAVSIAADRGLPVMEGARGELDRLTGDAPHQGLALRVPAYEYHHPDDLLTRSRAGGEPPLLVALDGVTDPHNLGAAVRSVAAFGGHGVLVPQRRSAGVTAATWKASAGALARVPVARASNLSRALAGYKEQGVFVVGLDNSGAAELDALAVATEPLAVVIGSEGKGLSRVVARACDLTARIPVESATESLNASVAAGIAMYEVARLRRAAV